MYQGPAERECAAGSLGATGWAVVCHEVGGIEIA